MDIKSGASVSRYLMGVNTMISREEAIKRLEEARFTVQPYLYMNEAFDVAIEALSHERPKGRWVCLEAEIGYYACSECDHRILRAKCNYCPNCGADMAELPNCGADMRGVEE